MIIGKLGMSCRYDVHLAVEKILVLFFLVLLACSASALRIKW